MSTLRFDWDERKAAANAKKHGVSFEEAKSVFAPPPPPPPFISARKATTQESRSYP
ncbi:MAG: BrnT family toxin [Rhodoferax sp.]|nr:BrnT family toxin [Rhodoferax sp.]